MMPASMSQPTTRFERNFFKQSAGSSVATRVACQASCAAAAAQLIWQAARVATEDPSDCLRKFRSNRVVGWLIFAGIIAGHLN